MIENRREIHEFANMLAASIPIELSGRRYSFGPDRRYSHFSAVGSASAIGLYPADGTLLDHAFGNLNVCWVGRAYSSWWRITVYEKRRNENILSMSLFRMLIFLPSSLEFILVWIFSQCGFVICKCRLALCSNIQFISKNILVLALSPIFYYDCYCYSSTRYHSSLQWRCGAVDSKRILVLN